MLTAVPVRQYTVRKKAVNGCRTPARGVVYHLEACRMRKECRIDLMGAELHPKGMRHGMIAEAAMRARILLSPSIKTLNEMHQC